MHSIDQAREKFEDFKRNLEAYKDIDLTESDTRSKILDEILKNVLGWTENDIQREGHTHEGYYDYLISIPNFKFIVEAKKTHNDFKLPLKNKSTSIGSIRKENLEVINQIRYYLLEAGLQHGIISNGHQFIIGKFLNSDASDWTKNKCLLFHNIDDISNRFVDFYNCLSKGSIVENVGFEFLNEDEQKAQIISTSLPNKEVELIRNSFSSNITPIINEIFNEIYKYDVLDDKELIEKCFVSNEEINKNRSEIERLFGDRPRRLSEISSARNTNSIVKQIKDEIESVPITLKTIEPPKPIIIVGSKGAGKTTFINFLFKVSFDDLFLKKRPYVYLDFRKYTEEDLGRINSLIIKDSILSLYEFYPDYELHSLKVLKRIYLTEIKRKEEAGWGHYKEHNPEKYYEYLISFLEECQKDDESHFIKLSEYMIRERSLRLCLIIDNADQFNTEVQKKAFLFAQSINRKAKCAVIISLREGYYYSWRNKPPFDAFNSNVYHVTAPPYEDVLQKRIDYALENFNLEGKTFGDLQSNYRLELKNNSVKEYFLSVRQTLFGRENSKMLNFLKETTYPNIREGLEVFNNFLLSGHSNVEEYILRQRFDKLSDSSTHNLIPIWEFITAVALENKKYYNHLISKINNVFYPVEGSSSQFLKIQILYYLKSKIDKVGYLEKYIPVINISEDFSKLSYKPSIIIAEINELLKFNLIETEDSLLDKDSELDLPDNSNISISMKGNYYVKSLIPTFAYMDLIVQDTPIFDDDFYTRIRKSFPLADDTGKRSLYLRKLVVERFVEYLKYQEKKETFDNEIVSNRIVENLLNNGLENDLNKLLNKTL
ncbi:ATP-binding protein [Spirosoma pollinicola]|uniref:AAA+ ATPase domain-containing protein n=1 Tax=Spirosoma pollinicola TaxID=2057025 RepID=A0A2K8Z066_9BACT|nr:hypothetical protein [Spirosoma pollinicola]AUD03272.1 hypothetical protein CWM47_16380 [Spirosoma pollinicola]